MFAVAKRTVELQITALLLKNQNFSTVALANTNLPEHYTLQQLYDELLVTSLSSEDALAVGTIVIVELSLRSPERLVEEAGDPSTIHRILLWISRFITPSISLATQDDGLEDDISVNRQILLERFKYKAELGLAAMQMLCSKAAYVREDASSDFLLSLIAFTDTDYWNSLSAYESASGLLTLHEHQVCSGDFLTNVVLAGFIRPLFSKLKPMTVTAQGRKAVNLMSGNPVLMGDLDPSLKPWKFQTTCAITIFKWAILHSNRTIVTQGWHLIIPPLLTLLDDPTTSVRVKGLEILQELLSKTPDQLLNQTGLGEVFEHAVLPTLLFLPGLTPVKESLQLLPQAYAALFSIADVRFPVREDEIKKTEIYDRVMRLGVLQGFLHSKHNALIIEVLLQQMGLLVSRMGIYSVKYLKDIIPIISGVLRDPFTISRPALLGTGIAAIKTVVLNCWPRLIDTTYFTEIIEVLTVCWRNILRDVPNSSSKHNEQLDTLRQELIITGTLLTRSVQGGLNMVEELKLLVLTDDTLKDLFGIRENEGQMST